MQHVVGRYVTKRMNRFHRGSQLGCVVIVDMVFFSLVIMHSFSSLVTGDLLRLRNTSRNDTSVSNIMLIRNFSILTNYN